MTFTFKRDEEGRETISVDGVAVARLPEDLRFKFKWAMMAHVDGVTHDNIDDAIERAEQRGFWRVVPYETAPGVMEFLPLVPCEIMVEVPS
jgi:hypothetical protein